MLIGSAWRCDGIAFSEYLDVIADRGNIAAVAEVVGEWLRTADRWQDAVFANVRGSSVAARLVGHRLSAIAHIRDVDAFEAHCIVLPGSGEIYARSLTPEVRRRTYGQRDRIAPASVSEVTAGSLDAAFQRLDDFTARRWQREVLGTDSRRFRADFARAMAAEGTLQMTELASAGEVVSVLYNVRLGDTEYYLQSGFDPDRSRGVSLGYQHFGHAIDRACAAGVKRLDLLGGAGRHRDYKQDFGTERERLTSLHVIRAPWLRALYALRRTVGA